MKGQACPKWISLAFYFLKRTYMELDSKKQDERPHPDLLE